MKHDGILSRLVTVAESDPNILGFLVFGSVASGTHREDSDIDVISILRMRRPSSGINNTVIDDIKVGDIFFTYEVLVNSFETVPYLLYPIGGAKLLFDRDGMIKPLLERIKHYFADHPEIADEWIRYYQQLGEEKAKFGCEQTTIIDVWNELEKQYSGGRTKRPFFNSFYMTNPRIFSILKRFL
jgi:predicted nucleotidyltransferase